MKEYLKILFGIMFMVSMLSVPSFSFAEMQINTQENEIIVMVSPKNPQPYESVSISISSYATDLSKAVISWQMDSKIVLSGIGKTDYSFTALGPNTTTNFTITIRPVGSVNTIIKSVAISPSEIELLWESLDGYVPPFYKGKAFPSRGSIIKAVAIPNTDTIRSGGGNISYSWKNNDSAVTDASGYNKNSFVFSNDLFDTENTITVIASSVDENYNAEKTITVASVSPKVIFYKKSPTEGMLYNNVLNSDTVFQGDEMTVVAVPYFLAVKGKKYGFNYTWNINGDQVKTPKKKTELTIRPTSRGGYADISITIESVSELFQKVIGQLRLTL